MQTFLPYESFDRSAQSLDDKRLGKQRSECMIILKTLLGVYARQGRKGWPHHPATKMWAGHERSLVKYSLSVCEEWVARGHSDTCLAWFQDADARLADQLPTPPAWLGDQDFHLSHKSNLLRKLPEHYRPLWPRERDDLPYIWPV